MGNVKDMCVGMEMPDFDALLFALAMGADNLNMHGNVHDAKAYDVLVRLNAAVECERARHRVRMGIVDAGHTPCECGFVRAEDCSGC